MKATFHHDDRNAFEPATDEPTAVAGGRGLRKIRNRFVVERGRDLDLFDEPAEAGAEDDAGVRRFVELGLNGRRGGLDLVVEVEHEPNLSAAHAGSNAWG